MDETHSDFVEHRYADLGDVRLHYVEAGEGPLVVLLHGFPQFWYMWRFQIPALAGAGFRVVAPDMRGYNLSDKPVGIAKYSLDRVATDIAELIMERGASSALADLMNESWIFGEPERRRGPDSGLRRRSYPC